MNQPNHPVLNGGTFGALSGEKPLYKAHVTPTHEHLVRLLRRIGLRFEETHGKYTEPERSVLIYHPRLDQMKMLGKMFGQEAVVFSQGGKHELHYTNGPHEGKVRHVTPGAPPHEWFHEPPSDAYTHIPQKGYFRINFDFKGDPVGKDSPVPVPVSLNKNQANLMPWKHPHAYEWHDGHTNHHSANPLGLIKADVGNDQAAGVGIGTYAKYATPFGRIQPGQPSDLMHYNYKDKLAEAQELVKKHGFKTYYAGGKFGKPDLANRNYNTNHLMIYDPTPQSGGDFGEQNYTDAWRQMHELSHALTHPEINKIYGEGRRIGKLGTHRTLNEAMRAVHWEHLAAHKQRELSKMIGVSVPDDVFNKEYNTVMHDAVHRAVTGKFTEPSQEGFVPNPHATPLDTSLDMLRDAGNKIGLSGNHKLIKNSELRSPILSRNKGNK